MRKRNKEPADPMAEVYEARRANLLKLAEQHGGKKNLGELLDYTNGSYISQLISRKRRMSEPVARKIETTLHLAHGWMDKAPRPVVDGA